MSSNTNTLSPLSLSPHNTLSPYSLSLHLAVAALILPGRIAGWMADRLDRSDRGQATAEYALVILGVAAIAMAVVSWVTRSNLVGKLLDLVFGSLFRKIL